MTSNGFLRYVVAGVFALILHPPIPADAAPAGGISLASHRAVYDLKLKSSPGRRQIEAINGRILYDFAGDDCEGYALQFRQVSEIASGEGKVSLSDLRATTWEDAQGKSFHFTSENYVDSVPVDVVDGVAERKTTGITVTLKKPQAKSFELESEIVFPSEHMRRIIVAAQEGKSLLELPVFDGSETGQRVYNTLTVIGHEIDQQKTPDDAAARIPELATLKRWPVTISYFDRGKQSGEQTPVYAIGFELYENGISRALSLDYGDFVVAGGMSQLELKKQKACK
jgi:hypothetical protein